MFCKYDLFLWRMAKSRRASTAPAPRSTCPIACALDLLGDRWSLLLVRDLFAGKSRYGEFLASAEGIPTNILADRLARLEAVGLITSEAYQDNPPRFAYRLAPKGRDLKPVLGALALWSARHVPEAEMNEKMKTLLRG